MSAKLFDDNDSNDGTGATGEDSIESFSSSTTLPDILVVPVSKTSDPREGAGAGAEGGASSAAATAATAADDKSPIPADNGDDDPLSILQSATSSTSSTTATSSGSSGGAPAGTTKPSASVYDPFDTTNDEIFQVSKNTSKSKSGVRSRAAEDEQQQQQQQQGERRDTLDSPGAGPSGSGDLGERDEDDATNTAAAAIIAAQQTVPLKDEWEAVFSGDEYMLALKARGLSGTLRSCRFRSVCWRLFLGALPFERSSWVAFLEDERAKYSKLKAECELDPHAVADAGDLAVFNPLSQADDNPWQKYFKDSELRQTIRQDVERTFPESPFFQSQPIQKLMMDILFCYSSQNTNLSYRQGMHELLAPVLFLMFGECDALLAAPSEDVTDEMKAVLDKSFIEHDSYLLFTKIMSATAEWYAHGDAPKRLPKPTGFVTTPFSDSKTEELEPTSDIVKKLKRIQHKLLYETDSTLYAHLQNLQIEPQLYGLRWIRLLLGREFHMDDVLTIWDAIFADSPFLSLIDYICVAMLVYIREPLLINDYMGCLKRLMKFPPVEDVYCIIEKALDIRDPSTSHRGGKLPRNGSIASTASLSSAMSVAASSVSSGASAQPSTATSAGTLSSTASSVLGSSVPQVAASSSGAGSAGLTTRHHPQPANKKTASKPSTSSSSSTASSSLMNILGSATSTVRAAVSKVAGSGSGSMSYAPSNAAAAAAQSPNSPGSGYGSENEFFRSNSAGSGTTVRKSGSFNASAPKTPQAQIAALEEELATLRTMNAHCGEQMHALIKELEAQVLGKVPLNRESSLIALAGLKQVKDMLRGNIKFDPAQVASGSGADVDVDLGDSASSASSSVYESALSAEASEETAKPHAKVTHAYVDEIFSGALVPPSKTPEKGPVAVSKVVNNVLFDEILGSEDHDTFKVGSGTGSVGSEASGQSGAKASTSSSSTNNSSSSSAAKDSAATAGSAKKVSKIAPTVTNLFESALDDDNEDIFSAKSRDGGESVSFMSSLTGNEKAHINVDDILGKDTDKSGSLSFL